MGIICRGISRKKAVRVWVLTVFSLMCVCLLLSLTLLVMDLCSPEVEPPVVEQEKPQPPLSDGEAEPPSTPTYAVHDRVLKATEDAGQAYVDRMVFVGESTTAHLRSRGVLSGGTNTTQVWSNKENTMTLDLNILQKTIRYPATGEDMTIAAAAAQAKPEIMVLSFGVNGLNTFVKNAELYRTAYGRLIDAIHEASPATVVLLQTVYPVAANQDTFAQGAQAVNVSIEKLNESLLAIAEQHGAYVVDTASVLKDERGMLRSAYQNGDGLHLETAAYEQILLYLRTHAYIQK